MKKVLIIIAALFLPCLCACGGQQEVNTEQIVKLQQENEQLKSEIKELQNQLEKIQAEQRIENIVSGDRDGARAEMSAPTETPIPTATSTPAPTPSPTPKYTFTEVKATMCLAEETYPRTMPTKEEGNSLEEIKYEQIGNLVEVLRQCAETGWYEVKLDGETVYMEENALSLPVEEASAFTYDITDGEVTITGTIADNPRWLIIPGEIEGCPVTL